ncbi:MAG: hypothetical protein LAO23_19545 [Acidobacteriia bacterium]|nr:hypothetical protein [Terriglobia bacterium]
MKRFLLFRGYTYYPAGGWDDFYGHYDTEEEAQAAEKNARKCDWYQVIDTETDAAVTGI